MVRNCKVKFKGIIWINILPIDRGNWNGQIWTTRSARSSQQPGTVEYDESTEMQTRTHCWHTSIHIYIYIFIHLYYILSIYCRYSGWQKTRLSIPTIKYPPWLQCQGSVHGTLRWDPAAPNVSGRECAWRSDRWRLNIHIHIHMCIYMYINIYVYVYIYVYMYIYMYVCMCVCMYVCILVASYGSLLSSIIRGISVY